MTARLAPDLVRSLAGQLAAIAILFVGTAVLAMVPVVWPHAFDGYLRETPPTLTDAVRLVADELAAGRLDPAAFASLTPDERAMLYEDWLARTPRSADAPRLLVLADRELYLARAQRTLVCGDSDQRAVALEFYARAGDPGGAAYLATVERWARGKCDPDLARGAARVRAALEGR